MASNFGLISLGIVLVLTLIEVLIGIKRGLLMNGFRLLFWALMTILAVVLANRLTPVIIMAALDLSNGGDASMVQSVSDALRKGGMGSYSEILAVPMAGLGLSAVLPFVFSVLFIIGKFFSWLLYIIFKVIVAKTKFGEFLHKRPLWSKIGGGVLGGLMGIYACALIVMPVHCLMVEIDNAEVDEAVFSIADNIVKIQENLEETDSSKRGVTSKTGESLDNIESVQEYYDSLVNGPAVYVFRFTGAECLSKAMYRSTSYVFAKDVGAEKKDDVVYSFPNTLVRALGIFEKVDKVLDVFASEGGLSKKLIDSIEDVFMYVLDTELFTDKEKLTMVNNTLELIEDGIMEGAEIERLDTSILTPYSSYKEFKGSVGAIFDFFRKLADIDWMGIGDSIANLLDFDVEELKESPEDVAGLAEAVLDLDDGAEILSEVINGVADTLSDGEISIVVTKEAILKADSDDVADSISILLELAEYEGNYNLTAEECDEIGRKLDKLEDIGLLNRSLINELRDMITKTVK